MTGKLKRRDLLQAPFAAIAASCAPTPRRIPAATATGRSVEALVQDPHGTLDLPEGFSYRVLQRFGDRMDDGYRVPARPDAMGCFEGPDGTLVLMRNHEMLPGDHAGSPYFPHQTPCAEAYDRAGTGGVTRVVLDRETLAVRSSNLVLAGTYWNCAGGKSPWGWLSCEETVDPGHGYVFSCATDADRVQPPQRISAYGRMRHEAAAVDPRTLIAYLTEDETDACFYRFVPDDPERAFEGRLQALRVRDRPGFETRLQRPGARLAIDWVDIEQPEAQGDSLRAQGHAQGAARFARTEGMWLEGDDLFFTATIGGPIGRGQIFRLALGEPSTLEVIAEASDPDGLDMPDNLCISPDGILYVAEDGLAGNFLRRVNADGSMPAFARNVASAGELAGPCFSPDGRTLFVNLQLESLTLAISGPFEHELPGSAAPTGGPGSEHAPDWPRAARGLGAGLAVITLAALTLRSRRTRAVAEQARDEPAARAATDVRER